MPGRLPWGWGSFPHPHPGIREFHQMPTYDVGNHAFDLQCPCRPVEDMPGSIIHNAYDGREAYEPGGNRLKH